MWQDTVPATLPKDGYLRALLVEHEALVEQVQEWCDHRAALVSSAGKIRRENLYSAVREWMTVVDELGGKGIHVYALVDYDTAGQEIFESHARWFRRVGGDLNLRLFGLTREQVVRLGLPSNEPAQIDGAFGLDPPWWRAEIRRLLAIA